MDPDPPEVPPRKKFNWLRLPWLALVFTLICLKAKEFFPFSHFPMYSRFPAASTCLYLADETDQVLFSRPTFDVASSTLKKIMGTKLKAAKKAAGDDVALDELPEAVRQKAGLEVLEWVMATHPPKDPAVIHGKLRLYELEYRVKDGKIETTRTLIAEK